MVWTKEAQRELMFWISVEFDRLESPFSGFFLRLPDTAFDESSTLRELRGAAALTLTIPVGCLRVVMLLDSQAVSSQAGMRASALLEKEKHHDP